MSKKQKTTEKKAALPKAPKKLAKGTQPVANGNNAVAKVKKAVAAAKTQTTKSAERRDKLNQAVYDAINKQWHTSVQAITKSVRASGIRPLKNVDFDHEISICLQRLRRAGRITYGWVTTSN